MKLEDLVCDLEYAKRLKDIGVKQESLFYYFPTHIGYDLTCSIDTVNQDDDKNNYLEAIKKTIPDKIYSAFTTSEILEGIPLINAYPVQLIKGATLEFGIMYCTKIPYLDHPAFLDNKPSNSLAKMLIYLIGQGLTEVAK